MRATPQHTRAFLARLVLLSPLILLSGCDGTRPVEPAQVGGVPRVAMAVGPSLSAPSALTATAISETRIDVAWIDNSSNESSFELYRSTTGESGTFTLRAPLPTNTRSYTEAVLGGTQYCFTVRAVRRTGNRSVSSEFSNVACATTPEPPRPPDAVSSVDAIPFESTVVVVSWDAGLNSDGFRVERSTDGGTSWSVVATVGSLQYGYWFSGLTSEQAVCYRVIAFNVTGDAPPSNPDCTTPPRAPTNVVATRRADGGWEITWTDNSAVEDGYELYYEGLCCGDIYFVGATAPNQTSFTLPAGWGQPSYVVATKDGGYSDRSYIFYQW